MHRAARTPSPASPDRAGMPALPPRMEPGRPRLPPLPRTARVHPRGKRPRPDRDGPVSSMYGWVDEVASWSAAEPESAAQEQDSSLAAMIGTVAGGNPATTLDRDMLRLKLVQQAKDRGLSWADIGALYGFTGKEMKRDVHALDRQVQRELIASRRNG